MKKLNRIDFTLSSNEHSEQVSRSRNRSARNGLSVTSESPLGNHYEGGGGWGGDVLFV